MFLLCFCTAADMSPDEFDVANGPTFGEREEILNATIHETNNEPLACRSRTFGR